MPVSSALFGDPCPGTSKYVEVHYTCTPSQVSFHTYDKLPGSFSFFFRLQALLNPKASSTVVIGPVCNTVSILDAKEHNNNHHHNQINYNYNNNHNSEDHTQTNNPITDSIYNYSEGIKLHN